MRGRVAAAAAVAALCAAWPAMAQVARPEAPLGEIVSANGDEEARLVERRDWIEAQVSQQLIADDLLRTGPYGGLGVAFADSTQIRLHANSQMRVRGPDAERRRARFRLDAGRVWSRATRPDQPIEFETPAATAAIRGTDWYLEVAPDGLSRLVVLEGEVSFFNAQGAVTVSSGEAAIARPGEPPRREALIEQADRPRWALPLQAEWVHALTFAGPPHGGNGGGNGGGKLADDRSALDHAEARLDAGDALGAAAALARTPSDADPARRQLAGAMIAAHSGRLAGLDVRAIDVSGLDPRRRMLARLLAAGRDVELGRFDAADQRLRRIEADAPGRAEPLLMRAWLEAYAGRYDAAEDAVARARRAAPGWSRVAAMSAQLALLRGDDAEFDAASAAALTADPADFLAWRWRGVYLLTTGGDGPGAAAAFAEAAALNPSDWRDRAGLGAVLSALGDQQGAIAAYEDALAIAPDAPDALAGLAFVYAAVERVDEAEARLAPAAAAAPNHPDVLAARAVLAQMRADPATAAQLAGRVVAANPGRPGAASGVAVARWAAGERDAGFDAIETAVRLDPNDANAALIAAVMAQDRAEAGAALRYARRAWSARERGRAAGFAELPATLQGRIDIGAAFANLGMPAWGEHYGNLAYDPYRANSAFYLATVVPSELARLSAVSQGLLLDPLAVSSPMRFAEFYRTPRHEARARASLGVHGDAGEGGVYLEARGFGRRTHPYAYAAFLDYAETDGGRPHSAERRALANVRFGATMNARHGVFARLTGDWRERELPGFFDADLDDEERYAGLAGDVGYAFRRRRNDQIFLRATAGAARLEYDNASAYGRGLDAISYSLANAFGADGARDLVDRGLFDTGLGTASEPILVLEPQAGGPIAGPAGEALRAAVLDPDITFAEETDTVLATLQARRAHDVGARWSLSYGLELARADTRQDIDFVAPAPVGDVYLIDAPNAALVTFPLEAPQSVRISEDRDSSSAVAHLHARWRARPGVVAEAGAFASFIRRESRDLATDITSAEEHSGLDPRLGLAVRLPRGRLRIALQRERVTPAIDTIAPLGAVGLVPTRALGVDAGLIDSARARLEVEPTQRVFAFIEAEAQRLEEVSAGLPGERSSLAAFFAEEGRLETVAAGLEAWPAERVGLAASVRRTWTENKDAGAGGGELPFAPRHAARIAATYVHPRQIRATFAVDHLGARYADVANTIELDAATVASASVNWRPDERRWSLTAEVSNLFGEDIELAPGVFDSDIAARVSIERRF